MNLRQMIEGELKRSAKLISTTDQMLAHWLVLCEDGKAAIIFSPLGETGAEKDAIFSGVGKLMRKMNAVAYVFASEVWMRRCHSEEEARNSPPPSECDDREELLLIIGVNQAGEIHHVTCPINEDRTIGEPHWASDEEGVTFSGRAILPIAPEGVFGRA